MAIRGQRQRAAGKGVYPANWPDIAGRVKDLAAWWCENCGHPHETARSRSSCTAACTHPRDGKQRALTVAAEGFCPLKR